jgi:hypothetical protein
MRILHTVVASLTLSYIQHSKLLVCVKVEPQHPLARTERPHATKAHSKVPTPLLSIKGAKSQVRLCRSSHGIGQVQNNSNLTKEVLPLFEINRSKAHMMQTTSPSRGCRIATQMLCACNPGTHRHLKQHRLHTLNFGFNRTSTAKTGLSSPSQVATLPSRHSSSCTTPFQHLLVLMAHKKYWKLQSLQHPHVVG